MILIQSLYVCAYIQTYIYKCLSNWFILRQHINIILNYPIKLKMTITITSLTMNKWFSRTIEAITKCQEVLFNSSAFEKFMKAMERFLFAAFTCILALGMLHFVSLMYIIYYTMLLLYTEYYTYLIIYACFVKSLKIVCYEP